MRRPYDLLALLDQEERVRKIEHMLKDLVAQKEIIDKHWASLEGSPDLKTRLYLQDEDCARAAKPLTNNDLYPNLSGEFFEWVRLGPFLPSNIPEDFSVEPDCNNVSTLEFSMHTFEHLYAMVDRANLSMTKDPNLVMSLLGNKDLTQFGKQLSLELYRNSSSWVYYNLGSIYWQMKGDAYHAVECARRAVHYAPRQYRDLALQNLGNIFHLAHTPKEAAIILHAAVDHAPHKPSSHFLLGNVYGILGDINRPSSGIPTWCILLGYQALLRKLLSSGSLGVCWGPRYNICEEKETPYRSVACYDNAIKLRPGWGKAIHNKYELLCYRKLEKGLLEFHESLQVILDELHGYHELQEQWIKLQGKLLWERVPLETKRPGQDQSMLSSMLIHSGYNCVENTRDGRPYLRCGRSPESRGLGFGLQMDLTLKLQQLIKKVDTHAKKLNKDLFLLGELDEGVLSSVSSKLPSSPWLTETTIDYQEFENPFNDPLSLMLDETPLDHYQPNEQQDDIPSTMPLDETIQFSENVLTMPSDEAIQSSDDPSTISKREGKPISQGITNLNHPRPSKNPSTLLQGGNTLAYHEPTRSPYYPKTMQLGEVVRKEPTRTECAEFVVKFPSSDIFPSVFLPPENKGFEVSLFLGELLNIGKGAEHELPWYPPLCTLSQHSEVKHYLPTKEQELAPDDYLRIHLLRYVNGGKSVEAEIGQRILSALIKMTGPSWLLQTLASLYWRVRGNLHNAMECLYVALSSVPNDYRDVVQVSLGSLLDKVGHTDEALHVARDALNINNIEALNPAWFNLREDRTLKIYKLVTGVIETDPATHFLLASLYSTKGNFSGASHHLKQVLRVDPDFISEGLVEHLQLVMSCREKFSHHLSRLDTEETCGASIPGTASSIPNKQWTIATGIENLKEGETLICSPDGEQCRSVQCFSVNPDSTSAKILALKSLAQEQCGGIPLLRTNQDDLHDETELEQMVDEMEEEELHTPPQSTSLGDGSNQPIPTFGMPYVLDPLDGLEISRSGSFPLHPGDCARVQDIDWDKLAIVWFRESVRNIDVDLPPLPLKLKKLGEPFCKLTLPPSTLTLDHLESVRLRDKLHINAEEGAANWLRQLTGEDKSTTTKKLGIRIALALQDNATSWMLANAAALYWRVVGRANHAISCLRQALRYVPDADRDIPLVNLASLLHRAGLYNDALTVAVTAVNHAPNSGITYFTVGNIYTSLGDTEKAIAFYRGALKLRPDFELARTRLNSVLCSFLLGDFPAKTGP
uniref:Tetratricopeptide repeat protein 17 n=1 Tax=Timema douglasi TaxID=61478 RepID=A0A7R8ZCA1_TIMDO|nr:unnamed protein product [Timema douglasi]